LATKPSRFGPISLDPSIEVVSTWNGCDTTVNGGKSPVSARAAWTRAAIRVLNGVGVYRNRASFSNDGG
jgi:hypothetical protein